MAGDQSVLKRLNRAAIVRHVKARPGLARGDLAVRTGLADSTVSVLVNELIEEGWLCAGDSPGSRTVGRRPKVLALDRTRFALLGAEMGVDFLNVVACDLVGEILFSRRHDYRHGDVRRSVRDLAALVVEARRGMLARKRRPLGVGIGLPGMVSTEGVLRFAPNIGWRDVAMGEDLGAALRASRAADLPVHVLNDANASALGEYVFSESPGVDSLVFLTLGYGVGAGIVLDDRLHLGHDGLSGEVGHAILQPGGLPCACGRQGCAETLLSQRALSRRVTGRDEPILHVAELAQLLSSGDGLMTRAVTDAGGYLALVVHNLIVSFNPEVVVLGGPLAQLGRLREIALESLGRLTRESSPYHRTEVRQSRFGPDAGAVGAAGHVLHRMLHPLARARARAAAEL